MPSNLFTRGSNASERTAAEVRSDQDNAKAEDSRRVRAAAAAGRDSRSIGVTRQPR